MPTHILNHVRHRLAGAVSDRIGYHPRGWSEGIPRVLRTVVAAVRKVRGFKANDFQRGIDELARETELDEIRKDLEKSATLDLERELEETIDPKGEMSEAVNELQAEFKETGKKSKSSPKSALTHHIQNSPRLRSAVRPWEAMQRTPKCRCLTIWSSCGAVLCTRSADFSCASSFHTISLLIFLIFYCSL